MVTTMRTLLAAAFGAGLPVLALASGCELVAGLSGDKTIAKPSDAGLDAPMDAPPDATQGCAHATYPPPPAVMSAGGSLDFVSALYTMDVGESQPPGTLNIGLDLDKTCTCEGEPTSCANPSWIPKGKVYCDGLDGRDNGFARLFALFSLALGMGNFGSPRFTQRAQHGDWSLLIRVRGYNGLPDDDQVEVSVYPTTGFAGTGMSPNWDGNDAWPIPSSSVSDGKTGKPDLDSPIATDANAWVTNGTVVASLKAADLLLGAETSRVLITLTAGVVMGKLTKGPKGYQIDDGIIAARWKTSDAFAALGTFINSKGDPFCTDDFYYSGAKTQLCSLVDIRSTLGGPTDPCDALSLGISFTAQPAKLGVLVPPAPPGDTCAPAVDPANDACDKP